ncbi:hypothetical protein PGIGA_G00005460 [Pangasianodon gigas]|uniref:Uncharacterized protein n=1 Tax=Pangasianodon gigas TaxID=30993 RepID=A0ACC5W6J6_PANGG|nr:hypothetical protein [Pangasianodon gigas]
MADSASVMLDKWEVYTRTGQTFELFQHVSLMTLDSIMKCAFSCQSNCQTERSNPYIKAVYELCNLVNLRFRVFPYHNDIIFHLSPHGYIFRKACKIAHTHTDEVIRQRREALSEKKKQDQAQEKRYLDFLDILLCAHDEQEQGLSDEAIRAEVDTFMFEGHDTTASGISWIFYSMACNPEHQQKCREEIQQVLMGKDTIEWEDLSKIPYTTMCIKESLRMYPPVPGMGRKLSQPITFFDGRTVPAGLLIGISIYGIHHNSTVWENPMVFDPLRFLPENTAKRSPHAFVPFSAGPRFNNKRLCDVTESASVDVLLTNLIKGNLLPSALLWITSRPGAANQIPPECVDLVTEVRGFSDPQKEEYFRKRISDQILANKIITHMKSSRSLYIMCHIPVFCWISATVLERMLGEAESGEIPKTLTQMFTYFLIFQIKHKDQKYHQKCDRDPQQTRESILALGKLAFQQLEKGNLIFYEEDLKECGINVREVSVYSGVCTQIFREEFGLHLGKVFSFVHLSVQEFLAALYAFLSFISRNVTEQTTDLSGLFSKSHMSDFLRSAVDKALQSENGHLDLFLRFLLGLSLESNQTLLRGLMPQTGSSSQSKQETVEYIKEKIRENPSPEKSINLFHCLNELNDHSLVQEVQAYLNRGGYRRLSGTSLSPAQWSALVFVILNSEQELDEFDLRKYDRSDECLLRLLPVVKASRKAE